jgi:CHAD domain-containing protein
MARRSLIETVLAPRIAALLDTLPGSLAGDVEAVHRARVASRRLREVLAPMRELWPDGRALLARHDVRRVTRALGPVRELDVATGLFDELATARELDPVARLAVSRALSRDRDRAQRRMRGALPPRWRAQLASALGALVPPVPPDGVAQVMAAIDMRVRRRGQRVCETLDHAGTVYVPERLHQVRIAVKQLRYALEVAGEVRGRRPSAQVAQLRRIQDLLGRAHDLHVLAERVGRVQGVVVRTSRPTAAALGHLARALEDTCRADHAAFMSRRPGLLTLCRATDARTTAPRRLTVA